VIGLISLDHREQLDRLGRIESYIGYKAFCYADGDPMIREDLAQEARLAVIRVLRRQDYPNSYLRKVARGAMLVYLRRGKSIDRQWPHYERQNNYTVMSLDKPIRDCDLTREEVTYVKGSFEKAADARLMLDQLETYLSDREKQVLDFLRQGYSQADVARMMGCTRSCISYFMRGIRDKGAEVWELLSEE
jgi:RNA polymerase sigma factor (sigma-70 family)